MNKYMIGDGVTMDSNELAVPAALASFGASFGHAAGKKAAVLMQQLFGPLCDQSGKLMGDYVRRARVEVQVRTLARAYALCGECDIDPARVNIHYLAPLLDACADAHTPSLQEMWARLIAAACRNEKSQHPAFISIARDLRPADAELLTKCVDHGDYVSLSAGVGEKDSLFVPTLHRVGILQYSFESCEVTRHFPSREPGRLELDETVLEFSPIGRAFVAAVSRGAVVSDSPAQ